MAGRLAAQQSAAQHGLRPGAQDIVVDLLFPAHAQAHARVDPPACCQGVLAAARTPRPQANGSVYSEGSKMK